MTARTSRHSQGADRAQQLVDAATTLFAERGYAHVSVNDIARRAGVSAPTLYRHFGDKQGLLYAAVLDSADSLVARTDSMDLDSTDDPATALAMSSAQMSGPGAGLWRWSGQHLSDEQNREVVRRTRASLRRWAAAIGASRPDLTDRESMYLAGAVLSVGGSMVGRASKVSRADVQRELLAVCRRILALTPSAAPPLPPSPDLGVGEPTRRDEILDAAARLFAEHGFAGTGVDEIGAAVGITGPSVYKHFTSKNAILVAVGQRSGMRLEAGVLAAYAAAPDPAGRLALLVDDYVRTMTGTPDLLVALTSTHVLAGHRSANELLDAERRYVNRWIDLLAHTGQVADRTAATLVVHAALSVILDAERIPRSTPTPEFSARIAYLMKGVLGL